MPEIAKFINSALKKKKTLFRDISFYFDITKHPV